MDFQPRNRGEAYGFVRDTPERFGYGHLGKQDKGMVLKFLVAAAGRSPPRPKCGVANGPTTLIYPRALRRLSRRERVLLGTGAPRRLTRHSEGDGQYPVRSALVTTVGENAPRARDSRAAAPD